MAVTSTIDVHAQLKKYIQQLSRFQTFVVALVLMS
jgi:hypothetical protein